jgi:phage-related minor tail protein
VAKGQRSIERIPRREPPEFHQSEASMIEGVIEDGFLNVALDDANQYGPHAMIMLLGLVSILTGLVLGLAMINPIIAAVVTAGIIGISFIGFMRRKRKVRKV